jgi:flagellar biosynthesis GTPase FlhF
MDYLEGVEIDEEVKTQVNQQIGKVFKKQLEDETQGLRAKVDELLDETKSAKEERERARQAARIEAEEKAKAENDYKQLFESQKQEADQLRTVIEQMNQNIATSKIEAEAMNLATQMTKDMGRAKLLQREIGQRLTLVDGELRVTDESGQLTVSSLDDLTASITKDYPFLIDGNQAQGGGAVRAQGGAESRSKEMARADFDQLTHQERKDWFESGGRIYDD